MTTKRHRSQALVLGWTLILALVMVNGRAQAEGQGLMKPEPSVGRLAGFSPEFLLISQTDLVTRSEIIRGIAAFLLISLIGSYIGYFGLFPRLLRKAKPAWPLDAWRHTTYGVWLVICLAVWAGFGRPLRIYIITPIFKSLPGNFQPTYGVGMILIPLMALVGLLVIWNFRRDVTNNRPA